MATLKIKGDIGRLLWSNQSPEAGDPACLCSACGAWIDGEQCVIRLTDVRKNLEARFCDRCAFEWLGIESFADDDDRQSHPY